ncbi:MAG: helix-hairpin-helix domain-containing protein [Marinifilaceae bacterium]
MKWQRFVRNYFSYSRGEKRGLLLLLSIVVFVYLLPSVWSFIGNPNLTDNLRNKVKLDSLVSLLDRADKKRDNKIVATRRFMFDPNRVDSAAMVRLGFTGRQIGNLIRYRRKGGRFKSKEDLKKLYTIDENDYLKWEEWIRLESSPAKTIRTRTRPKEIYLFAFDPNTLSPEGWDSLGVSPGVVRRIQNYLKKGGRFRKNTDLKKIYGLDRQCYERLLPFVSVRSAAVVKSEKKIYLGLNGADSLDLIRLKGIGPVLSGRILKYRRMLGGFNCREQLSEVYGVKDSLLQSLLPHLYIDSLPLTRININTASIRQLKHHPYISGRTARDLIRYRERVGGFDSLEVLVKTKLVSDSVFNKVRPYLSVR